MPIEPDESFDFLPGTNTRREVLSVTNEARRDASKREEFPFLIADHAFDARSLDAEKHQRDPHAVCLSFAQHELAYVHLIHPSGWGDVTLVRSGERGWIPVDYFSVFNDARAVALLAAIAAFLAQPRSQKLYIAPQRVFTFSEAAINEIISGTKMLLTRLGVLSRDAPLVFRYEDIALARKALLTELAHLVHIAKMNKHTTDPEIIDKLVRSCFRILERTLVLLQNLDAHSDELEELEGSTKSQHQHQQSQQSQSQQQYRLSSRSDSQSSLRSRKSSSSRSNSHSSSDPVTAIRSSRSKEKAMRLSSGSSRSTASTRSGSSALSDLENHIMYRMNSFTDHDNSPEPSMRLREVVGAFFYYLEHFLDPNQAVLAEPDSPNTPSMILAITRHCMLACRELLVVFDASTSSPWMSHQPVEQSPGKEELLAEIRKLVGGARSVVAALPPSPATLRIAAAQSMTQTALRCRQLTAEIARSCAKNIAQNQNIRLPEDRSYPIFKVAYPLELSCLDPSSPTISPQISPKSETLSPIKIRRRSDATVENVTSSNASTETTVAAKTPFGASGTNTSTIGVMGPGGPGATGAAAPAAPATAATHTLSHSSATTETSRMGDVSGDASADTSLNPSLDLDLEESQDELVMRNGRVRGGSLTALVRWLTSDYTSLEFEIRAFLLCFRLFAQPRDLVIEFGSLPPSGGLHHIVQRWIESFWEPEDQVLKALAPMAEPEMITARQELLDEGKKWDQVVELPLEPYDSQESRRAFSNSSAASSSVSLHPHARRNSSLGSTLGTQFGTQSALNLAASFREFSLGARRASRQISGGEDSLMGRMRAGSSANLLDNSGNGGGGGSQRGGSASNIDTIELLLARSSSDIAQQLTLMWYDIFRMMRPSELLDQRFSSSKRSLGLAPHVTQLILSSNHLTAFVGDTILSPELSTKQRSKVIKHWIKVVEELYNLGNLNGAVTIVLTLQSTRIARLTKAWESMGHKAHTTLAKFLPLVAPDRNFQEYRRELRSREGGPCLPYLGLLLGDLTLIDEGNPKYLKPNNAINFDRCLKTAHAIASIQGYQHTQFSRCVADVSLQSLLRTQMARSFSQDTRDSDEQWRRSLLIQPED